MTIFRALRTLLLAFLACLALPAQAPVITGQPVPVSVAVGGTASFSVTATGSNLTYLWRKDGVALTGKTSPTLTLTNVQAIQAGVYSVRVRNTSGTVYSDGAALTIGAAPTITTQPTPRSKSVGQSTTFTVVASGDAPLAYQWFKDGVALADGSNGNGGSTVSGATTASLTLGNLQQGDAGTYSVVVSNSAGSVTSSGAQLTITQPPVITSQPLGQTVQLGQAASFSVAATGATSYQWQRLTSGSAGNSWVAVGGIDQGANYTFTPVLADSGAQFRVVVSGPGGSTTSATATLTVVQSAPPTVTAFSPGSGPVGTAVSLTGSSFSGATAVKFNGTSATFSVNSNTQITAYVPAGATTGPLSVTNAVGTGTSASVFTVTTPPGVAGFSPASAPVGATVIVTGSNFTGATAVAFNGTSATFTVNSDTSLTATVPAGATSGALCVTTPQGSGCSTSSFTVAAGTAPTITGQPQNQTVTAPAAATFTVTATGAGTLTYQWKKNGADLAGATAASYTTPDTSTADNGAQFTVVVTNSAGSVTSNPAILTVNSAPTAPTITTQPQNQAVTVGQTATFTVTATGTAPLGYQWSKDGVAIAGATAESYTTPATVLGDHNSQFQVAVSNSVGGVNSTPATLTVSAAPVAPSITTQPLAQTVTVGQAATFTVVASGSPTPSYQWRKNGADLAGATAASYTTPATVLADNGAAFSVVVSNGVGSPVTSASALLTVTPPTLGPLTWKRDVIYLGSKEVAEIDTDGTHVTLTDHLGSPRFLVRGNGQVIDQKFAPFGESLTPTGDMAKFAKGYTNHEQTDPSGLIYMQARFYLPMYGRFGSPDPKLDQHFQETQSWNIYSYVRNNPVMNIDPDGMESVGQYLDQAGQSAYEKGNYGSWVGLGFLNAAYKVFTPGGDSLSQLNSRAHDGEIISNKELLKTGGLATAKVLLTAAPGVVQSRMALAAKAAAGAEAATTGGAAAVRTGQAGEAAVRAAFDIGKKEMINVGGRMRIPDGMTNTVLSEVKNVKSLSWTSQLRDFATYAKANGLRFDLYVRKGAELSKPLLDARSKGLVNILEIPAK